MSEESEEFWEPTMELRWKEFDIAILNNFNAKITETELRLQQKWVSGTGTADDPFKVKWVDVPTVSEEK